MHNTFTLLHFRPIYGPSSDLSTRKREINRTNDHITLVKEDVAFYGQLHSLFHVFFCIGLMMARK